MSGTTGSAAALSKTRPGLGSSALISATICGEILGIDAAEPHQLLRVAAGEQRQVLDEPLHRRVEAVALLELERQALGEVAGEDAGRIEALQLAAGSASTRATSQPSSSATPASSPVR